MRLLLMVAVTSVFSACSNGSGGGIGGGSGGGSAGGTGGGLGGGSGGGGGASGSGPFLFDRATETATPQLATDGAGVLYLLASRSTVDSQGHAYVRYAQCASGCERPSAWTSLDIGDGPLSSDVKLAVEPTGVVHTAQFSTQAVRFGRCASNCTTLASWTFTAISPPTGTTFRNLPRGRAFAVSASGRERLVVNGFVGGNQLLLLGNDGAGWTADPLVDGEANAVSLVASGETAQLVSSPLLGQLTYAECTATCGAVAHWAKAAVFPTNAFAVGLARGASGELHVVHTSSSGPTDRLLYARCSAQCLLPGSWTSVELGDGTDGRGGLDVSVRPSGVVAVAGATPAGETQLLNLRRCASNCTQAASWSGGPLEAGTAVNDAHPAFNGAACDEAHTLRYWTVGESAQLVPTTTGWMLGYDATSYSRCLGASTVSYVSGIWVRLNAQPEL